MKKQWNAGMVSVLSLSILLTGTVSLTQSCKGTKDKKEVNHWFSSGEWLNGLELKPHSSTNEQAFEALYKASPLWWDQAFEWLKTTDLDTIGPGTYIIEEGNVRAIVSEAPAPVLEDVKWEAHKDFSDIQYIVKGKTQMGVAPVSEASVTEAYDSAKDIAFYDTQGEYYTAEPGTFFIFTPEEAHRPGIHMEGYDTVKKVVLKIRAQTSE
ncbi:MAG: YhcH/YjgK/YiaL family protein [Bacteroidota bacterium]